MADIRGLTELQRMLKDLEKRTPQGAKRALTRCGLLAVRESKANAPRSPTNAIQSKTLKRKKRTSRRMMPGGLEKSIEFEATETQASVFVARNSYAGAYAKYIHDEKYVKWRNRGAGTIAKGERADEKFIERAVNDNQDKFKLIVEDELKKAIGA